MITKTCLAVIILAIGNGCFGAEDIRGPGLETVTTRVAAAVLDRNGRLPERTKPVVLKQTSREAVGGPVLARAHDGLPVSTYPDTLQSLKWRVDIINVGAGNCVVVQCDSDKSAVLADCGTRSYGAYAKTEAGDGSPRAMVQRKVSELLRDRRVVVAVTHPDKDHHSLVEHVMGTIVPNIIFVGGGGENYGASSFSRWARRINADHAIPIVGEFTPDFNNDGRMNRLLQCGHLTSYILTVNSGDSDNSKSLAIGLTDGAGNTLILPGDAEGETERKIMEGNFSFLQSATVLVASHHGATSEESNGLDWAQYVRPRMVVYSAGDLDGHPHCAARGRYQRVVDGLVGISEHPFRCNYRRSGQAIEISERAEFVTGYNGDVKIAFGQGEITVGCDNCGGEISFGSILFGPQ